VAALRSPNKATQHVAYRALAAMGEKAVPALKGMFESNAPRMRARALALLARVPREANAALAAALQDKDSDVVIAGIRLATMLATSGELDTSVLENMPGLVGRLVGHADPAVRRQLAVSLHHAKQVEPMWAKLAAQHDGSDRWYLEALGIGARGIDDSCFDAWFAEVKGQWDTASGHDIVWRLRTPKVAPFLAKLILRNPPEQRYLRAFDFVPDSPERTDALLALAKDSTDVTVVAEALQRLVRTSAKDAPSVVSALEGALARTKGRAAYVDLVAAVGVGSRAGELLEAALQLRPAPEAMDAIRMLVKDAGGFSEIQSAIKRGQVDSVEAIFGMLGDSGLAKAVDLLANELKSVGTPERRSAAIRALARTQSGAEALVNMAKGGVFPSELRGVAASALAMVQYASLKDEISKQFPQAGALGGKPLPAVSELVKVKGDVAHGKEVFERAASSCVTCHKVGAKGVDFGPGLGAIGAKLPKEALYDAIINPNAGISMGFETSEVRLRSGGLAMGIVRSETQDEVVLVLPGGALQKVPRTDVQQIKKLTVSMMPSGLNQALTQQDLVDLVEYLSTLRDAK
jgi:putative heme-binding domain-containing protein